MFIKIFLTVFLVFSITACNEPTVDGSNKETTKVTLEKIKETLPESQHEEFDKAVEAILFADMDNLFDLTANADGLHEKFSEKVDGMNAQEIIHAGNKILANRLEKQRKQAKGELEEINIEINKLDQEKEAVVSAIKTLENVEIKRSRFYFKETDYSSDPIIELTVKNNLDFAISRIYFDGTLASNGRSVPWVQENFNYAISGGLEPQEETTWRLAPNKYGAWGRAPRDRDDMVLTVRVVEVEDAEGNSSLNGEFSQAKEERLQKLLQRRSNLIKLID